MFVIFFQFCGTRPTGPCTYRRKTLTGFQVPRLLCQESAFFPSRKSTDETRSTKKHPCNVLFAKFLQCSSFLQRKKIVNYVHNLLSTIFHPAASQGIHIVTGSRSCLVSIKTLMSIRAGRIRHSATW